MKNIVLTVALTCFFATFSYSQFQIDVSSGLTHRPSELSGIQKNGFYIAASPSVSLKDKFRLRTTVQFRRQVSELIMDHGSIDLSPELEYELCNFLSIGAGFYVGYNKSELGTQQITSWDAGPVGSLKFRFKDAFATIRYTKGVSNQISDFLDRGASFSEQSYFKGIFQFGLGYTFGKK